MDASGTAVRLAGRLAFARARGLATGAHVSQESELALIEDLVNRLGSMKGALMKIGQMISFMTPSLSEESRQMLSRLQANTQPLDADVVEAAIEEEFGKPISETFSEWSPKPFAAASIGQVHRARHRDGRWLAVKVQYPGIEKAMAADLQSVALIKLIGAFVFRGIDGQAIRDELRERLLEECDYRREAREQRAFRELWRDDREIAIPAVIDELSSRRVLTSELCEAQRFADFASTATQTERDRAGTTLMRFAYESILRHHVFNCDPHPGNYLFEPKRVTFLDFGSVKRFSHELVTNWARMLAAILDRDMARFRETVRALGIATERGNLDLDAQFRIGEYLSKPWLKDEEFQFDENYLKDTLSLLVFDNPNKRVMNLPPDLLFLNRLQWGLYAVLGQLRAKGNFHRWMKPLILKAAQEETMRG